MNLFEAEMADAALDDDVDVFVTAVTLEDAAVFCHNQVSFDVRSCLVKQMLG